MPIDTKQRILDTAERLIGQQGYAGTSLRQIISAAGVNLAAVHYHFGSKEDLLDELISRKADPVNAKRLALLDRYEAEAGGGPVEVEKILAAFFDPMVETCAESPDFVKVMGRIYSEGLLPTIIGKHFFPTIARFVKTLRRALPTLPEGELAARLQFMVGAMSHALLGNPVIVTAAPSNGDRPDFGRTLRRLTVFLSAGFRAPASEEVNH